MRVLALILSGLIIVGSILFMLYDNINLKVINGYIKDELYSYRLKYNNLNDEYRELEQKYNQLLRSVQNAN